MTLQDIDNAFRARVAKDKKLAEIRRKIAAGKASFKDTAAYSERISNLLGETLSGYIEQIPASERAKVCEWLLRNQYNDTNEALATVQRALDKADGIRLAPQKPPFPAERVGKVSGALTDVTAAVDVIRRRANAPVANVSKSFHDDYMKRNAQFRSDAGLQCYINREPASGCCKWCTEIAGRYEYNSEPHDVYRRHDNCSCTVTYENGRMRQDVWSKRQWEAPEPDAGAEPPTVFTDENRPAGFQPKVLTGGENVARQSKNALQNAADGGRIYLDYRTAYHDVTNDAVQRVPHVSVSDDEVFNERYRIAAQDLLRKVKESGAIAGTEFSVVYDRTMNRIGEYIQGGVGHVRIDNPDEMYHALHNHGSGLTFSLEDLIGFTRRENMLSISAFGYEGSVYCLMSTIDADKQGYSNYLDILKDEALYEFNGISYTYDDLKNKKLNLDLLSAEQHIILENNVIEFGERCAKAGERYGFKYFKQSS